MNQNQNESQPVVASLTTSGLSPLAKPFTLNRSSSSYNSMPKPLDRSDDNDPFSSLLDSFRKSNLASISKGNALSLDDTLTTTTLHVEAASLTNQNSLFEQHPFLKLPKNGDFDGFSASHFCVSLPNNSPCVTSQGLFGNGKGNDAGNASMLQKEKSTGTIVAKDNLLNSEGTIQAGDESSSFLNSCCKVAPLKLSTDIPSSKSTPPNQFSSNSVDSDTDVDSPCWKGTVAFSLTPPEISGSVQFLPVETATEKHNSLNPLAPQFFPGIGYIKDDFLTSNSSITTNLLPGKDTLVKTVMAESPVELSKGVGLEHYSDFVCGREKTFNKFTYSKSSSMDPVLNLHCTTTQSYNKEECMTSKGKPVTIGNVDYFVKGPKNPGASLATNEDFPAKGHSPTSATSSSQANVVTDLKTFEGFLKSLIESPKPDVKIMINAMHVLSELLAHACEDSVDSYSDGDLNLVMITQIINNLNDFITNVCGQRISNPDSAPANSTLCLDRSLKLTKGLEMANVNTLAVPHQFYLQNDYMGKNMVSKVVGQSGQSSFASSSGEGTKKGNEIAQFQVIRRSLGKSLDIDELAPEASIFWNLWLDSEAERCFRKYKTYDWLMEAGLDVNCNNVTELWR